jgi:hypothetical protein
MRWSYFQLGWEMKAVTPWHGRFHHFQIQKTRVQKCPSSTLITMKRVHYEWR